MIHGDKHRGANSYVPQRAPSLRAPTNVTASTASFKSSRRIFTATPRRTGQKYGQGLRGDPVPIYAPDISGYDPRGA
jgi:hypothetical protein